MDPHTWPAQKQDDQHERTFSSYVRIQVVVLKTYLGRWTIGGSGERGVRDIRAASTIWWWWWNGFKYRKWLTISIWPTVTITPIQSGPGSNGNEGVLGSHYQMQFNVIIPKAFIFQLILFKSFIFVLFFLPFPLSLSLINTPTHACTSLSIFHFFFFFFFFFFFCFYFLYPFYTLSPPTLYLFIFSLYLQLLLLLLFLSLHLSFIFSFYLSSPIIFLSFRALFSL